jgi:hypothetical protein
MRQIAHCSHLSRVGRAQDELALKTASLETAVCVDDFLEGDALGDARPDGAFTRQAPTSTDTGALSTARWWACDAAPARPPSSRGAEQAAALERCELAAIAVLADAVKGNVESARQDTYEVFALVVNRRRAQRADHRHMFAAGGAP